MVGLVPPSPSAGGGRGWRGGEGTQGPARPGGSLGAPGVCEALAGHGPSRLRRLRAGAGAGAVAGAAPRRLHAGAPGAPRRSRRLRARG